MNYETTEDDGRKVFIVEPYKGKGQSTIATDADGNRPFLIEVHGLLESDWSGIPSPFANDQRPVHWPHMTVWPPRESLDLLNADISLECLCCGNAYRRAWRDEELPELSTIRCENTEKCNRGWFNGTYDESRHMRICRDSNNRIRVETAQELQPGEIVGSFNGILKPMESTYSKKHAVKVFAADTLPTSKSKGKKVNSKPYAVIDAQKACNYTRFINHSCSPNCEIFQDSRAGPHRVIGIRAKRRIREDTQLTVNYLLDWGLDYFEEGEKCACRTSACVKPHPGMARRWAKSTKKKGQALAKRNRMASTRKAGQVSPGKTGRAPTKKAGQASSKTKKTSQASKYKAR